MQYSTLLHEVNKTHKKTKKKGGGKKRKEEERGGGKRRKEEVIMDGILERRINKKERGIKKEK